MGGEGVLAPGDHDDGGLQGDLESRLSEAAERGEHSRPGNVLVFFEMFLSLVHLVHMPGHQGDWEEHRTKEDSPENELLDTRKIPMEEGVSVRQQL